MSTNILIVEDEPAIQELIAINLKHAGFQSIGANSAETAEAYIRNELPDLLILDWMLPGQSGVAFARKLRTDERTRDLPIILLTARVLEEDKVLGLETGADDYVTKPFSPKELIARVRAVLRRRAPHLSDAEIKIGNLNINPATHAVTSNSKSINLGPTEFRLLLFFMSHKERVYSRTQLLNEIWGDHVFIEERTVDVHIRRLRLALKPTGHDTLIETVRGAGYRLSIHA